MNARSRSFLALAAHGNTTRGRIPAYVNKLALAGLVKIDGDRTALLSRGYSSDLVAWILTEKGKSLISHPSFGA